MTTKRSGGIVRAALLALAVVGLAGLCSGCGGAGTGDGLLPRDYGGGDTSPAADACARVCQRDSDCCPGEVCHPSFKACVPPCGVFGMPCCGGTTCDAGLVCVASTPSGPTCAPQP